MKEFCALANVRARIELKVQEKETVNVPLIVSAGVIAIGVFLLVGVGRK